MLETGELVTDEIVFQLLENRLKEDDIKKGFILDGFPRTINQAYKYNDMIKSLNIDLGVVIILDADYDTLEKRIVGRMICQDCGSVYNTLTGVNKPLKEGICDKCGAKLSKRSDDNKESFKVRYDTYLEKTKPLIDYYQETSKIYFVDSKNKESMLKEVEDIIND